MSAKPEPPAAPSRALLESLFRSAVAAAHPDHCLPPNLPDAPAHGRLVILAAGKAAGSMTQVAERHYEALGFQRASERENGETLWRLDLATFQPPETPIEIAPMNAGRV